MRDFSIPWKEIFNEIKESKWYNSFLLFIFIPTFIFLYSIIFTKILHYLFERYKILYVFKWIEEKDLFLWMITISMIYYTLYFKKKRDDDKIVENNLNNFALIEPIPVQKEAFMHNEVIFPKIKEIEKWDNIEIISNWRQFLLKCIEPFPWYKKFIHLPFSNKKNTIFSLVNKWKSYGIVKYLYIMYNKKENENSSSVMYFKEHNIDYTIQEIGGISYVFPFNDSYTWLHVAMSNEPKYDKFYEYFTKNSNPSFVIVIRYKSILNNKEITQAYKAIIKPTELNENNEIKEYYIDSFTPMRKKEIMSEVEESFAKEIIDNSIYKN